MPVESDEKRFCTSMAAPGEEDIFHHVRDFPYFHLPFEKHIWLPNINLFGHHFQITKFMVLQVVAGLFLLVVFRGLSRRIASGQAARGGWWNFWETLALYIRDNVVRPTIGDGEHHGHAEADHTDHGHEPAHSELTHPADKYLPYVWTCFFYVLICNLLGAFPWLGSPTGEINVTGALAAVTVVAVVFYGSQRSGFGGFWLSLAPSMELSPVMKVILVPVIWIIELAGFVIKHGVLAIRLFANMMGGHTVVAVIMLFIAIAAHSNSTWLYYVVVPSSIFGQIFVGTLELLFAFVQAYIFAFLATLFIGMAVHPH
jgi:F-type H+-transporting ATPase subunit a